MKPKNMHVGISRRSFIASLSMFSGYSLAVLSGTSTLAYADGGRTYSEEVEDNYEMLGYDIDQASDFFDELKQALISKDLDSLGRLVAFPLRVKIDDQVYLARNFSELYDYENIFFSDKILNLVQDYAFEDMFVNAEGLMIGNGEIWIKEKCLNPICSESKFFLQMVNVSLREYVKPENTVLAPPPQPPGNFNLNLN